MSKGWNRLAIVLALGAVAACTGPGLEMAGDAMVELGDTMRDVGRLGMSDAAAEPVVLVADCVAGPDGEVSVIYGDGHGSRSHTQQWSASVSETWIDPERISNAVAVVCGHVVESEQFPPADPTACPDGATCTTTPYALRALECTVQTVEIEDGIVRAYCGIEQSQETIGIGGVRERYWRNLQHRQTVRFLIDQR